MARTATKATKARAGVRGSRDARPTAGGLLRRHRFELGGLVLLVLFGALVLAWPSISGSAAPALRATPDLAARFAVPTTTAATPAPAIAPSDPRYQPPKLTEQEAVDVVASRRVNGVEFTQLRQTISRWSAEYRGDGTWLVHGGDATWLLFEQSRQVMPANRQAMNLETPAGRRTVK